MMVVSPNAPRLVRRWGTKWVVVTGIARRRGGDAAATRPTRSCRRSSAAARCGFLFGVGLGLTSAPATESIMGSLPPSRAGVGSAINDTTRQTGGALGVAIIGSVFLAALPPLRRQGGRPARRRRGPRCTTRSGGRSTWPAKLPAKQGDALVQLSRDAFVDAMRITYPIAAAIIVFAAFIAWRCLPAHGHDEFASAEDEQEAQRDQRVRDPRRRRRVACCHLRADPLARTGLDPRGCRRGRRRRRARARSRATRSRWRSRSRAGRSRGRRSPSTCSARWCSGSSSRGRGRHAPGAPGVRVVRRGRLLRRAHDLLHVDGRERAAHPRRRRRLGRVVRRS